MGKWELFFYWVSRCTEVSESCCSIRGFFSAFVTLLFLPVPCFQTCSYPPTGTSQSLPTALDVWVPVKNAQFCVICVCFYNSKCDIHSLLNSTLRSICITICKSSLFYQFLGSVLTENMYRLDFLIHSPKEGHSSCYLKLLLHQKML